MTQTQREAEERESAASRRLKLEMQKAILTAMARPGWPPTTANFMDVYPWVLRQHGWCADYEEAE